MIQGKTEPRIWTKPLKKLTRANSLGFAFNDFCEALGVDLLPWQKWLAIHALETVTEGRQWRFRYRYVLILVSRQNGKTFFEVMLNIFFLYGLKSHLVLGTAQNLDTAVETFEDTVAQIESVPELKELLQKVNRGTGKRELLLDSGDRYKVIAATRKARGLSSDLILMDELREQTNWDAWGAISKTMMARPTAILFGLSNAGDVTSVVLRHLRLQAHAQLGDPDGVASNRMNLGGEDTDGSIGLFEWSAVPDCEIDDREQWAQANPSLGFGFLTERALKSAMQTDPEPIFRTECLCQWVESRLPEPFPEGAWLGGRMLPAYKKLREMNFAMSVEVWQGTELVGGLYGVTIGRNFFGESMFSLAPSASKLALIYLAYMVGKVGGIIDCQFETPHLKSMGGTHIPYDEYMQYINPKK